MAYKFNALTGKMDLVNSAAEISADLAITGETFEKHGNLEPQVLDHVPVNEVMSDILFSTYAPKVTANFANDTDSNSKFNGETISIKPGWIVEKQSNDLSLLKVVCTALGSLSDISLTQNTEEPEQISAAGATTTVYAEVSDVDAFSSSITYEVGAYVTYDGNTYRCTTRHTAGTWNAAHFKQTVAKKVVLTGTDGARLSFEQDATFTANAYDNAGNKSKDVSNSVSFHYPIIIGSINDMSVKAVTLTKNGVNWEFSNVILGNDTATNEFKFAPFGRDGRKSFSVEITPKVANSRFYPIVLVQKGLKVAGVAEVSGQTETPITPGFVALAVKTTFKIANVTEWADVDYDRYMLVRDGAPATADKIVYKISITTK